MAPHQPLVLHIPHSARTIPPDLRKGISLSDEELQQEILRMTDWYTDELYRCEFAETIRFPVSRLIVDPERFRDDAQELMASLGMGAVYETTASGAKLRDTPSAAERETLLESFYVPHHAALTRAVKGVLRTEGVCLVIDCHSFPNSPLPYELDQNPNRPDLCLGTDPFHTPAGLYVSLKEEAERIGFSVARDTPFSGALVPLDYYTREKNVASIMFELNRRLYMDERTGEKLSGFSTIKHKIDSLFETALKWQKNHPENPGPSLNPETPT